MLKIFRKIRRQLISKNRFTQYFIYAIGEISLVMIGILLALQVNNWSSEQKSKKELRSILRTISYDLETDTTLTAEVIAFYENHQKMSQLIIDKKITVENYADCQRCGSLTTFVQSGTLQKKGYELLKSFSNQHTIRKDSLLTDITQFYTLFLGVVQNSSDLLTADALQNFDSFKQHSWFVDFTQNKTNPEMIAYFSESEDYRKRVAAHSILAHGNYLALLKSYQLNATEILRLIKERLGEDDG